MIIGVIEGYNCLLKGNGADVGDLHVVHDRVNGTMTSAWFPTPAELAALNKGAPVYVSLYTYGALPQPIYIGVKQE
jgi:hypothetical protein